MIKSILDDINNIFLSLVGCGDGDCGLVEGDTASEAGSDAASGTVTIDGTAAAGQEFTTDVSTIGIQGVPDTSLSFTYQWQYSMRAWLDDAITPWVDIANATSSTYTIPDPTDIEFLRVKVVVTAAGETYDYTSAESSFIDPALSPTATALSAAQSVENSIASSVSEIIIVGKKVSSTIDDVISPAPIDAVSSGITVNVTAEPDFVQTVTESDDTSSVVGGSVPTVAVASGAGAVAAGSTYAPALIVTDNLRIIQVNPDSNGSSIFNTVSNRTFIHDFNAEDNFTKFNAGNDGIKWGLSSSSPDIFDDDENAVFSIEPNSGVLKFTSVKYTNSYKKTQFTIDISATSANEVEMHRVVISVASAYLDLI